MTTVSDVNEVDTVSYWLDVHDALVVCCGIEAESATKLINRLRLDLSGQSKLGQLLVYHESVANTAFDIWRSEHKSDGHEDLLTKLISWYTDRIRNRE